MRTRLRLLSFAVAVLAPALVHAGRTAHSLAQVPGLIRDPAGQAAYREQMGGVPRADGFGTTLPAGVSAADVLRLVAPGRDPATATLVGMRPWPASPGRYVAIACFAATRGARNDALKYNDGAPTCSSAGGDTPPEVHLGVLAFAPGAAPVRVATSDGPVDVRTSWAHSDLIGPDDGDADAEPRAAEDVVRFDLAPFRLNATDTAFGLRMGWNVGYAGGGAYFEALALFRVVGDRIVPILSEPMYTFQDLAGDWHEDGTRDHDVDEDARVLTMLAHETGGMRDLRIGPSKGGGRVFAWDAMAGRYVPVAAPARRR